MNNTRSIVNPFSRPQQSPEHRAILDALKASMRELETTYNLTWHLNRYPSRYERMVGKAA